MTVKREPGRHVSLVDMGTSRVSRSLGLDVTVARYVCRHERPHASVAPSLPEDVEQLPTRNVARFVKWLAQACDIQYQRSGLDDFTEAVTRTAGDDVKLDLTGKLLVALKKHNGINGRQFARLMANHIREIK